MSEQEQPREPASNNGAADAAVDTVKRGGQIIAAVILLSLGWYLLSDRFTPYTDQARVQGYVVGVAPIVLPPFLFALTNPSMYLKLIMKSVLLGQQGSVVNARDAGRELLGSTFMAGIFAILFWFLLKLSPTLWMFFLWTLLFGLFFAARLFGMIKSRYPASYWSNVAVTMLILLGSAVQDSADGDDVYSAFASRMSLFIVVTCYAWGAVFVLERWRYRQLGGAIKATD